MSDPTPPPSPTEGAEAAAKPAEPGPKEPPSIAASILPQRKRDADRHPAVDPTASELMERKGDEVAAEEIAIDTVGNGDQS